MTTHTNEYRISRWFAEFSDPGTEQSFQRHFQHILNRQLRIALVVWALLLLVFAIPDYQVIGARPPFFYLLAYRVVIALALFIIILNIKYDTSLFSLSYAVTPVVIAGFSGFMMLFFYRPDAINWTVGVIMIMLISLLMFIPIRFSLAFLSAVCGVIITLLTRFVMGSSKANLIGLFFILMLPLVVGATTARRLAFLQRKQFALLSKTAKINQELEREIQQRLKLEATLKELAATDPLTGLYNRREYEMLFAHEMERARRLHTALSVCIIDLDHFKKVNDTYGHGVGDDVLRRTAAICRKNLRTMDIIGRLGGEEFIILLPETAIDQAVLVANRLLSELSATDIDTGASVIRITATIGISQLLPGDQDANAIIQRADAALYRGKEAGRSTVEVNLIY